MGAVCPPPNPKVVRRAWLRQMLSSRNVSLSSFTLSLSGPVLLHWNVPIVPAVHLAMQPTATLLASAGGAAAGYAAGGGAVVFTGSGSPQPQAARPAGREATDAHRS